MDPYENGSERPNEPAPPPGFAEPRNRAANPYLPPGFESKGSGAGSARGSFGARTIAAIIDSGIVYLGYIILVGVAHSFGVFLGLIASFAYFVVLEGRFGQTVGKFFMGLQVIDARSGGAIGYPRAFIRTIGKYVSTVCFLLGYLWMLWDPNGQTWHDKMASAVVAPGRARLTS